MGLFVTTDAKEIKDYLIEKAQEGCNTTLYQGDERRIFIESVVTPVCVAIYNKIDDVAKQKMRKYARGEVLDAIGGKDCPRLEATKATTTLQFFVEEPAEEDILIPTGTTVTTNDDHDFVTDIDVTLAVGTTSVNVSATASEGGEEYNGFAVGTIAVIVDGIDVDGCKNITVSEGGDDGEPYDFEGDNRYRQRIELYEDAESTCGGESGYRYYALTANSTVADANVINPEEVGASSQYDVIVYIICDGGTIPSADVIAKVQEEVSRKDRRPMCEHINTEAATQVTYSIQAKVSVSEADAERAKDIVEAAAGAYVKEQDTSIAMPINPDQLFAKIMKAQDADGNYLDIRRCQITSPTYRELTYKQVGKCTGINITYETV